MTTYAARLTLLGFLVVPLLLGVAPNCPVEVAYISPRDGQTTFEFDNPWITGFISSTLPDDLLISVFANGRLLPFGDTVADMAPNPEDPNGPLSGFFGTQVPWPLGPASLLTLRYEDPPHAGFVVNSDRSMRIDPRIEVFKVKFWNALPEIGGPAWADVRWHEARGLVDQNPTTGLFSLDNVFTAWCDVAQRVQFRFEALDSLRVPRQCLTPRLDDVLPGGRLRGPLTDDLCNAVFFGGREDRNLELPLHEGVDEANDAPGPGGHYLHVVFVASLEHPERKNAVRVDSRVIVVAEEQFRNDRNGFLLTLGNAVGRVLGGYPSGRPDSLSGYIDRGSAKCDPDAPPGERHLMCAAGREGYVLDAPTCANIHARNNHTSSVTNFNTVD